MNLVGFLGYFQVGIFWFVTLFPQNIKSGFLCHCDWMSQPILHRNHGYLSGKNIWQYIGIKLTFGIKLTIELGRIVKQTKSQECRFIKNSKQWKKNQISFLIFKSHCLTLFINLHSWLFVCFCTLPNSVVDSTEDNILKI